MKRITGLLLALLLLTGGAAAAVDDPAPATAHLLATGDLVPHVELMYDVETDGGLDYALEFGALADRIAGADYAFCTVEAVFVGEPYLSYPLFHAPDGLARSLRDMGYDLICCASNHAVDGKYEGVCSTLALYDSLGLDTVGMYRSREEWEAHRGVFFRDINGIRFAFLNYTAGTNCLPMWDRDFSYEWAVGHLFQTYYEMSPRNLLYDQLAADVQTARDGGADAILAVLHWGAEFAVNPAPYQRELADLLFQQGVDVIIGGHPHVPEAMERRTVTLPEGEEKTVYLCYSLGNLLSAMINWAGDITPFVDMTFEKDPVTGKTEITSFSYRPVYRAQMKDYPVDDERDYRLLDMDETIAAWEAGKAPAYMSQALYKDVVRARETLLDICGTELYAGAATD